MTWFNRIVGALFLIVLILLSGIWAFSPQVVRNMINDQLQVFNLQLNDASTVRLNPFTSKLTVSDLTIERDEQATLQLDLLSLKYRLLPLFTKKVEISHIELEGLKTSLGIAEDYSLTDVAGFDLRELENARNQKGGSDKALESEVSATKSNQETTTESNFSLTAPLINLSDVVLSIKHTQTSHQLALSEAQITGTEYSNLGLSTSTKGDLSINDSRLKFESQLKQIEDKTDLNLKLKLKDLNLSNYHYLLENELASLTGLLALDTSITIQASPLKNTVDVDELEFSIENLAAANDQLQAEVDAFDIEASTLTLSTPSDGSLSMLAKPSITLSGFSATEPGSQDLIASFEELLLDTIETRYEPEVEITNLAASTFASEDIPQLLQLKSLKLEDISLNETHIDIQSISIASLISNIVLNESGLANIILPKESDAKEEPVEQAPENKAKNDIALQQNSAPAEPAFTFKVGTINTLDSAKITINDQNQDPEFSKTIFIDELAITNIDSSDVSQEAQVALILTDQNYLKAKLNGTVKPFGEKIDAQINTELAEFSLPEVNGYLANALGFEFKTGQLDANLEGQIQESQLDTELKLVIRGSDFSASNTEDAMNLIGQSAVPLNVALGMLKNKQGDIKLTVPIRGDLNDPSFGAEYLLALVVKKAVMRQTKNYLMTTFVPYAQVVNVALAAGSYALKVRFEDMPYDTNQIELDSAQEDFASQLSQLMKDKPKLQVKVCPVAVAAEQAETPEEEREQAQISLANERAAVFKAAMVTLGVDSSRLLICGAKIDKSEDAKPRLAFSV